MDYEKGNGSFELVGGNGSGSNLGTNYVQSRSNAKARKEKRKSKRTNSTRLSTSSNATVDGDPSPTSTAAADVFDYAYPKKPKQHEEHMALVSSEDNVDPDDPLAGGGVVDEFDDEMDEIEMREEKRRNFDAFGDTEVSPLKKRLRQVQPYAVPILICILFLLGVIAGILYLVGTGKSNTSASVQEVPPSPEDFNLMCDVSDTDRIATATQVPELCQDHCLQAECCWNPEGGKSCTPETTKHCRPYRVECAPWKQLLLDVINGDDDDDYSFSGTGIPDDDAADDDGTDDALDHVYFLPGLTTACARTLSEVSQTCRDECEEGACCWKNGVPRCEDDPNDACGQFRETCGFLNDDAYNGGDSSNAGTNTNWPFPDAPDGLAVYCDPAEMEEISLHICEDKCAEAECCWKMGVASCISQYQHEACHDYTQACSILNDLKTAPDNTHDITSETPPPATATSNHDTLEEAPANLEAMCSKELVSDPKGGGEALIQCEQACLKGSCCWQPNAASPCTDNAKCGGYNGPCGIFVALFDKPQHYDPAVEELKPIEISSVPLASATIASDCRPDRLKTSVDGGQYIVECEKECLVGACCWKENHPTKCDNAPECADYMGPCGNNLIEALLLLENGVASRPTNPPVEVPAAPDDMDLRCSLQDLNSNPQGRGWCEESCNKAECCWKEQGQSCSTDPACVAYQVCKNLLVTSPIGNGNVPPTPPPDLATTCSAGELLALEGLKKCEDVCAAADCCWLADTEATSCKTAVECRTYETDCDLMHKMVSTSEGGSSSGGSNIVSTETPEGIRSSCDASTSYYVRSRCEHACRPGECCIEGQDTCLDGIDCQVYQPCGALFGGRHMMLRHR